MKNRPARVRELIQRELGALLMREMTFDAKLVTVQSVDLTADFKHCHVHVGVMGTEREQRDAMHALAERRPQIQHELSKHVVLKYTPRLHFHLDTSVERGVKVMEIMRQVDEITPPESAEAAARRTDAYAEGDTDHIDAPTPEELDPDLTPEEAEEADEVEEEEDDKEDQETRKVRTGKDAKGRGGWHAVTPAQPDSDDDE